jgi:hypothetical protein
MPKRKNSRPDPDNAELAEAAGQVDSHVVGGIAGAWEMAVNRLLVVAGAILLVAGLAWPWLKKLNLFRLPGDIVIDRPNFHFFLPLTTMAVISAVLTFVAWLMRR